MSLIEQLKGVKIVNPGFLLDLPTGLALDDQGYLKIRGIIFDKYTGLKLDDDGNIVTAGILSEKPTGFYIDEEGWLYHNGGIFILDESLGIRIDEEGRLYKMHWTGLDERIELKDAIRIPLAQSEPVDYASEYNTSSSTSSTNTDERSLSGSSGGGSSGKIIFWVFASLVIIIYAQFDKKADAEKIENQRAKMQAMLPEIARSKMDSTLLVPPKNGIVKFGPKATISVAANGLKIDYPRERKSTTIYFSDVRSFYNLNNPKYDDKNHPCFTVVWAHYELNQITWRFRHPSDLTFCLIEVNGYEILQEMNRAYNAWRENYPKVVEFFQLEAAEPILSYHKDISGIYAFCNEKAPKKKLHSQIVTQNGPVVTFNGPNYRGEGFFNGKHGTAKLIGGEPKETSRLDFYVDNENRLHGRISQPTKTDFRYIGFLESR